MTKEFKHQTYLETINSLHMTLVTIDNSPCIWDFQIEKYLECLKLFFAVL